MSTLFPEQIVWFISIDLIGKNGASNTSVRFARAWWDTGTLYTTNQPIYPLLVSDPVIERSAGRQVGIEHEVTFDLYAHTHFQTYGQTLSDFFKNYELTDADVYVSAVDKALTAALSNAEKFVGKLTGFAINGDIITIAAKEQWFKEKDLGRKFIASDYTALDSRYAGEYGSLVFGEGPSGVGVVIDAPYVANALVSNKPEAKLFAGFTAGSSHPNNALVSWWVKNPHRQIDASEWLKLNRLADPQTAYIAPEGAAVGYTAFSLQEYSRGRIVSPDSSGSILVTSVRTAGLPTGTITNDKGQYFAHIHHTQYLPAAASYAPLGSSLQSIAKDVESTTVQVGTDACYFQAYPQVPLSEDVNYLIWFEWTNFDDAANYLSTYVKNIATYAHAYRNNAERNRGWEYTTSYDLWMYVYGAGDGDDAYEDRASANEYSYYHIEGKTVTLDTSEERFGFHPDLEFKLGVKGIEDDGSGTYTGVANGIIEYPADIIRFILQNATIGHSIDVGEISTSTFTSATSANASEGVYCSIVIDGSKPSREFIADLCLHGGFVFYRQNDGTYTIHKPAAVPANPGDVGFMIRQGHYGDQMAIESVYESGLESVINDIEIYYGPDPLSSAPSRDVLRKSVSNYAGHCYSNDATDSSNDFGRIARNAASIAKYGRRELILNLPYFDYDNTQGPKTIANYLVDRYGEKKRSVVVRAPYSRFYTVQLFSTVLIQHEDLSGSAGSGSVLNAHNDGQKLSLYYKDMPVRAVLRGEHRGEVTKIVHQGYWSYLTIEEVGSF